MRVLLLIVLSTLCAGCASPAVVQTASAPLPGPTKTVEVTAHGQWSAITDKNAYVGSGWPRFEPPARFHAANVTIAWTAQQRTGDLTLQFAGDGGKMISSAAITRSPQSIAFGADDPKLSGTRFVRLLLSGSGAAAQVDFTVTGAFEVPT